MYLQRYHDVQISPSGVWRILKRLDINRLPASQRYHKRWKRYEKQRSAMLVNLNPSGWEKQTLRLWLGIDVACRAAHQASLTDERGQFVWSGRKFRTTVEDLRRLWAMLPAGAQPSSVTVIMEPTRNAWVPLAAWFRRQGATVVMVATRTVRRPAGLLGQAHQIRPPDSKVLARLPLLQGGPTKSGDACLREALFMAADQARRADPTLAAKYHRLMTVSGKHHTSALCHIATALRTRIAACLRRGEPYQLTDTDGSLITAAEARRRITDRYSIPTELRAAGAPPTRKRDGPTTQGVAQHSDERPVHHQTYEPQQP